jgi:capsular exopolysaccharide synthesis family protein
VHEPGESVAQAFGVLWKHRWAFLLTAAMVVGGTAAVVYRMPPVYRTTATLEITPPRGRMAVEDVLTVDPFQREYFQTLLERIELRDVLGPVHDDFGRPGQSFEEFVDDLEVRPEQSSNLVRISYEGEERERIVGIVNGIVSNFLHSVAADQTKASLDTRKVLNAQADGLRRRILDARAELDAFMEKNGLLSSIVIESNMLRDQLAEKAKQSETDRNLLAVAEANHDEFVRGAQKGMSAGSTPYIAADETYRKLVQELNAADQELAHLSQSLGHNHPMWLSAQGRRDRIEGQVNDRVRSLAEQAEREFALRTQVYERLSADRNDLEERIRAVDRKKFQYDRIQRDLDRFQGEYESYLKASGQIDPVAETAGANVKVREPATLPERPVKPRKLLSLLLAAVAGLFAGALAAFGLDSLDDSIKSREDVARRLGLPLLGEVPALAGRGAAAAAFDRVVAEDRKSAAAESWRSIRTALLYSTPGRTCRSILVTSARPGEGKTLNSVNLALAFAQAGHRTLLIDADLRRSRIHRVFALDNARGLTTALVEGLAARELAASTGYERLSVLTTGPIPPNPSEILGSDRMQELLRGACSDWDRVVIDSPPIEAVTDAAVLAPHVDAVVQVVLAGETRWQDADQARRQILAVGGRHLGAILNGVRRSRRGYDGYYHEDDAPDGGAARARGSDRISGGTNPVRAAAGDVLTPDGGSSR